MSLSIFGPLYINFFQSLINFKDKNKRTKVPFEQYFFIKVTWSRVALYKSALKSHHKSNHKKYWKENAFLSAWSSLFSLSCRAYADLEVVLLFALSSPYDDFGVWKEILSWPKVFVQPGKKLYILVENYQKVKNKKTNKTYECALQLLTSLSNLAVLF